MNENKRIQYLIETTQDDIYCSLLDSGLVPSEAYNLVFSSDAVVWNDVLATSEWIEPVDEELTADNVFA
jgi:hypothetical protein